MRLAEEWEVQPLIVGGLEAYKVVDLLVKRKVPVLVSLNLPKEPKIIGQPEESNREAGEHLIDIDTPLRIRREAHRRWRRDLAGVRKLDEAGVVVGFTTAGIKPDQLAKNLDTLQKRGGLSEDLVLKLLTIGAAAISYRYLERPLLALAPKAPQASA